MADTTNITIDTSTINAAISGDFSKIISTNTSTFQMTQYGVNLADTVVAGVNVIERTPPKDPYSGPFDFAGFGFGLPSTPRTGRGVVEGTVIGHTNLNLSHGCMIFADFGALLGGGLTSEIQALLALPPARIQMSAQLRLQFSAIIQELRTAIDAILEAVGMDPTGMISYVFSQAKALLRMINYWLKDIKQLISDIQSIIMFVNQLFGIIQYLLSLPAQLLAIVHGCISSFLGSVMSIANSFENIPAAMSSQVNGMFGGIVTFASSSLDKINTKANAYKQKNPQYSNLNVNTITPQQIQQLIANVAITNPNTYYNAANTVAQSNSVQTAQNSNAYVANAIFTTTSSQNLVLNIINYDVVYANAIYANNITCNNIIIRQNTIANTAHTNELYANAIIIINSNTVPIVNVANAKSATAYPSSVAGQISYDNIFVDYLTANTIVTDFLVCNVSMLAFLTMNTRTLFCNTLTYISNTVIE